MRCFVSGKLVCQGLYARVYKGDTRLATGDSAWAGSCSRTRQAATSGHSEVERCLKILKVECEIKDVLDRGCCTGNRRCRHSGLVAFTATCQTDCACCKACLR